MSTAALAGLACARTRTQRKVRCPCQRPRRDSRVQDSRRKCAAVAKSRVIASRGWHAQTIYRPWPALEAVRRPNHRHHHHQRRRRSECPSRPSRPYLRRLPCACCCSLQQLSCPSSIRPTHLHLIDRRSRSSAARDRRQPEISCQ